ncbi:MAG: AAA family ATPase [Bacteroidota bacterium]
MRIERLVLESFGAFRGAEVEFAPGLNLFYGENEHGKSTLIDGLLLTLLGAPANAERRQRYAPLDGGAYASTIQIAAGDGSVIRIERDLGPGGQERAALLEGERWSAGRKAEAALKRLTLPTFDLARATAVICGSEVVLAGKDAGTVSKAISARATADEGAVTGQQALKRLRERRVLLENKERAALEENLAALQSESAEIARAAAMGRELEEACREAGEKLEKARAMAARCRPAVEAFDQALKARQSYEEIARRHRQALGDLQAIRRRQEELARLERELAPFQPYAAVLAGASLSRFNELAGAVRSRREEVRRYQDETRRLRDELAILREKLVLRQNGGFTHDRQRELVRLDGAVEMAAKNLAAKDKALAAERAPGAGSAAALTLAGLAVLAGAALGAFVFWPGWLLGLAAAGILAALILGRGRAVERRKLLSAAREEAAREVELARAAFSARSGGRTYEEWLGEFSGTAELAEAVRDKEAELELKAGVAEAASADENELSALLTAAGCASPEEFVERASFLGERQGWLKEARAALDSLLRGRTDAEWAAEELALAQEEAVAKAVLDEAAGKAAGLDPVAVAGYREELAAVDLPALEKAVAETRGACDQHIRSARRRDPWEVETGLALAREALADNARRAAAARLAIEALSQAVAEVQGNLIPRIQDRAGSLFARLTGGRYSGLSITSGPELLHAAPLRDGSELPVRVLSSGTADQMYLALRLALAEALQGPDPLPLILDDPFLTFDRPRLGHALDLLGELSAEHQVILVTKDETLRNLAVNAGFPARGLPGAG